MTSTAGWTLHECGPADAGAWNAFVDAQPDSDYCQLFEWKAAVEAAYGLRTCYLAVREGEDWVGVMPVVAMPALPGLPRRAVSLSFCNYGDALARTGTDLDAVRAACLEALAARGLDRVEVRGRTGPEDAASVTYLRPLPADPDALWQELGSDERRKVRRAGKHGLTVVWDRAHLDAVYDVYAVNMGRLGTPVHSRRFFREIVDAFGPRAEVAAVLHQERVIGGMLVVAHNGVWADPFVSCLPEYRSLYPNMALYWEALRMACERGAHRFDFGRSTRDSGTARFKRQWGAEAKPLAYRTYVDGVVQTTASTDLYRSGKAQRVADLWRRLPLSLQCWLGPALRRHLP